MTVDLQEPAGRRPSRLPTLSRRDKQMSRHACGSVLVTRLRTTYDGGTSVVWHSRALSPTGRLSRRHQMTVLELIIVVLDGRVGLCVFVHDIIRYVER